jgi:GTP-binding protein Era
MNAIVGQKVAIVSNKPQTTRKNLLGVANLQNAQVVFIDTPGIHKPHSTLGKVMVDSAVQAIPDADAALFVVDVSKPPSDEDKRIARLLRDFGMDRVVVALNKMDRLRPEFVESHYAEYTELTHPAKAMYTTALTGDNLDKIVAMLVEILPEGPPHYDDPDFYTDQTVRDIVGELIREQVLHNTREEVPHGVAVQIEAWEEPAYGEGGITKISASIVVERESQKPILIGKGGAMLKKIGTTARAEIEKVLGAHIYLELFVKVREHWRDNPTSLRELGLIQ